MSVPTQGESYSKLIEYLRKAQEEAATLGHLASANDNRLTALGWLTVSEALKKMQHHITLLAQGKLQ